MIGYRRIVATAMLILLMACSSAVAATGAPLSKAYNERAARLIGEALLSTDAYDNLQDLTDRIGHRLSGSPQLERAIDWSLELMQKQGLQNVHREPVMVPVWVRGHESARIVAPVEHELTILGLGMSVGTPAGGLTADVVVVDSFPQLEELGEAGVKGKIVLYDVAFETYGETVQYRVHGASRAAQYGAVAALVRSIGPISYDTPHTGTMHYADEYPKIPTAAVTIENSTLMGRLSRRGETIRVKLEMGARQLDDALSANVVGEVVGSERPDEVVVIGGHLDSWDVGTGAQDDGVGCMIALEAAHLIQRLDLHPRRTIRVVLFTNEENGSRGGKEYHNLHVGQAGNHVAMIESDSGNGPAGGFRLDVRSVIGLEESDENGDVVDEARRTATAILEDIARLLEPLGAGGVGEGWSGVDVGPMVAEGVPGLGLDHDTEKYWYIHHTNADTFEKIDLDDLNRNVAAMAVMTYVLADMPGRLVEPITVGTR